MKGWGAPNPCPFASREGLGPLTLVHLQVVQGWGGSREGLGPNPCPFANRGWGPPTLVYLEVGPNPCPFGSGPQPNPCPFASREGLGGGTLHLQVVKGWGGGGLNPCPFASWGGGLNPCPFASREGLGGVGGGGASLSICASRESKIPGV